MDTADGFFYFLDMGEETDWNIVNNDIERIQRTFSRTGVPGLLIGSSRSVKKKAFQDKNIQM